MGEVKSAAADSSLDITSHLPLQLIKSDIIPPAPRRSVSGSEPTVDFLPDFAGHSWIAYAASSLVVISHFPNPLLKAEAKIGQIYRQVVQLSREVDVYVSAVCWSPATPSAGKLAVAFGDCIALLSYNESSSFCWSQTAMLLQSMKVDAIRWTGSGDGIISGGTEVLMWRRKEKSWEIAWSFRPKIPHALVSATWLVNGFSATAPWSEACEEQVGDSCSLTNDARKCVLVHQFDGLSKYSPTELHHPMPVQMIQWRPSIGKPSSRHARHALRPVLLTCCLDGAVRLWAEIDDGRIRKAGKDNSDQKSTRLIFCVLAVIEVNQSLNGVLGSNVVVSWATELEGVAVIDEEVCYFSCLDNLQHNMAGRCEWLIGLGPEKVTTIWAINCLDDFAPVRFPRVTLWKKHDFSGLEMEASKLLAHKVLIMRPQASSPPVVCSFVQFLPSNSFSWTQLYSQASVTIEEKSSTDTHTKSSSTAVAKGLLGVEGHSGKILQIAIHPFSFEVELAASLDRNGTLLLWSFSTFFNSHIGLPMSTPSWKLCGKKSFMDYSPSYTCLSWVPTMLGIDHVVLMGHANGIDGFIVKTQIDNDEKITFHNLFSITFRMGSCVQGLSSVSTIPLPSNCGGNFDSSKFLLIALCAGSLVALSWEITIHSCDSQFRCSNKHWETFESQFSDKIFCVSVDPCSSVFPVSHNDDKVTSCEVVCPSDLILSLEQKLSSTNDMGSNCYAYHLVTGYFNGNLKLWRSMPAQSSSSDTNWAVMEQSAEREEFSPGPPGPLLVYRRRRRHGGD